MIGGIGLHTGYSVNMRLVPAPVETGILFRRTDLRNFAIEATRGHVARVASGKVVNSTVERLLSALYSLGIDNLYIDLDSMEVPIMDGSGKRFIERSSGWGWEQEGQCENTWSSRSRWR